MVCHPLRAIVGLGLLLVSTGLPAAETFRIATYNVENYLDQPSGSRPAKSEQAKNKVRDGILALKPDASSPCRKLAAARMRCWNCNVR